MNLMDDPKDSFYSIQMCLWLKDGNKEMIVMIYPGILDQLIIGPFKVKDGVKHSSANFCDFMEKTLFAWLKSQSGSFKLKCVFMQHIAPSHESKLTHKFFKHKRFTGEKIIEWPS